MDINDIEMRIERAYSSIGQRFDKNIKKYINLEYKTNGNEWQIIISFDRADKAETLNCIFTIIANIAKMKDHLKKFYSLNGGEKQEIENEIEFSDYLKLVIDLDNQDKHEELDKSRSGKYPHLDNVGCGLTAKNNGSTESNSFTINPFTGEFETHGNIIIEITAEIKDKDGKKICSLDELIDKSMGKWEEIIKKYNIINVGQ